MVLRTFLRSTLIFSVLALTNRVFAQQLIDPTPIGHTTSADTAPASSSNQPAPAVAVPPPAITKPQSFHPFSQIGFATQVGLGGIGFDLATPLTRKLNLRTGVNFFSYATNFQEQGANIRANLQMLSSHASLDWFPFRGHFHLGPQIVFANNNHLLATAIVPPGSTISLNGQEYISSPTDPLRGSGRIEFRKIAPGFSLGFGDIIPRGKSGISIPVEFGFYYVGQPSLQVGFTGSACDPRVPSSVGCRSVDQDPGFQQNLAAFIARNNHNLSYASFFPIFSIGFAYNLW